MRLPLSLRVLSLIALFLSASSVYATPNRTAGFPKRSERERLKIFEIQLVKIERDFKHFLQETERAGCTQVSLRQKKVRLLSRLRYTEKQIMALKMLRSHRLLDRIHSLRKDIRLLDKQVAAIAVKQRIQQVRRQRQTKPVRFSDALLSAISGTVTDASTSLPLSNIEVDIYDTSGSWIAYGYTDTTGNYTVGGIPNGTYFAETYNYDAYIDELYDNIPCEPSCDVLTGTPIILNTTATADFALQKGGSISGTITDASTSAPIENIYIQIFDSTGGIVAYGYTDAAGNYTAVGALVTGNYFARTDNYLGYFNELYDDIPCPSYCNPLNGDRIPVLTGTNTPGIDFALKPGGKIFGTVTDAGTGAPVQATVDVYDSEAKFVSSGSTDQGGNYQILGLQTGTYYAVTENYVNYLDELYDNIPCFQGNCFPTSGTPISVTEANTTAGINFALQPGGSLSGEVSDNATGAPIPYATVNIYDHSGFSVSYSYSDDNGLYTVSGLPTGNYFAVTYNYDNYLDELYDNISCYRGQCNPVLGNEIGVTEGSDTSGINFALDHGGNISGTITDSSTSDPILSAVLIYDSFGEVAAYGYTDASGGYTTSGGLGTGNYYAVTYNYDNYVDELYDNISCPFANCNPSSGTVISVTAGNTTGNVNFALDTGGTIAGTITSSGGSPIQYFDIHVYDSAGNFVTSGFPVGNLGNYEADGLPTGNYYVSTQNYELFADELFDNLPCTAGVCSPLAGSLISVTQGSATSNINFSLDPGGTISGHVSDSSNGSPIPYNSVSIYDSAGTEVAYGYTDSHGNYTSSYGYIGLNTGTYYARAYSYDYVSELYDDIPCIVSCDPTTGTQIPVTAGSNTGNIDFALDRGGTISGTITDQAGNSIPYIGVNVYDTSDHLIAYGYADQLGHYTTYGPLATADYHVLTHSYGDYRDELYDDIPCTLSLCDLKTGTPVSVVAASDTAGIDFALQDCPHITLLPNSLPAGTIGDSYTQTILAGGGAPPYNFLLKEEVLPDGLSLDAATGTISGVPTRAGIFYFAIAVLDGNGCGALQWYSMVVINPICLFCDDFNDGVLATNWDYEKGNWVETGGDLVVTNVRKARAIATPAFTGCVNCKIEAEMQTAGGNGSHVSLIAWYQDHNNMVELQLKKDRLILRQRSGGTTVAKARTVFTIDPGVKYSVRIQFDGSAFHVLIGGTEVMIMTAAGTPSSGTVGFEVKATTGTFGMIDVE